MKKMRFVMKFLTGEKKLPSKSEMLEDMHIHLEKHHRNGYRKRLTHFLGPEQKEYFNQLTQMAEIENIPEVMSDMHFVARNTMLKEPEQYQNYKYTIIDDKTFIREKYDD